MKINRTAWFKALLVLGLGVLAYLGLAVAGLHISELPPVVAEEREIGLLPEAGGPTPVLPTPTIAPLLVPSPPAPAAVTPAVAEHFLVDRSTASDQEALDDVRLTLRTVERTAQTLVLQVALENKSDQYFLITGSFNEQNVLLTDADGNRYQPLEISPNLRQVSPPGGFAPGAANLGSLTFPRPAGREPFLLSFLSYEPIQFWLDTPAVPANTPAVPSGDYVLAADLTSQQSALAPITLRVDSIRVEPDSLTFVVAFVNTSRQGYDLLVGPKGGDAWLLDTENRQYRPAAVSEALREAIDPAGGWQPGQAYTGTITFPRPERMAEIRFVFPDYNALSIQFDAAGLVSAAVTSPSGGQASPPPTLEPQAQLLADLDRLLAVQAAALLAGDAGAYLATFSPDLRADQELILNRVAGLPLETYQVRIFNPPPSLRSQTGRVENVSVQLRYTLAGLPADNPFVHIARYDFTFVDGRWLVSAVRFGPNPPFWTTGEVAVSQSDHFLIFTRPEVTADLPALIKEAEAGYAALAASGLPLAPRYAAYFSATQADFQELTGQRERVVGAAAWRYDVQGEAIEVLSRAFYLNGEAFATAAAKDSAGPTARQLTIIHELVHLALAADTRPFTPPWLTEGMAVYYAGQNTPAARQRLLAGGLERLSLVELTRADVLGEPVQADLPVENEYTYAGEAIRYLVETYGEAQVLAFYRSYTAISGAELRAEVPESQWSGDAAGQAFIDLGERLTVSATRQFFGRSLVELDAGVKSWLANQ